MRPFLSIRNVAICYVLHKVFDLHGITKMINTLGGNSKTMSSDHMTEENAEANTLKFGCMEAINPF